MHNAGNPPTVVHPARSRLVLRQMRLIAAHASSDDQNNAIHHLQTHVHRGSGKLISFKGLISTLTAFNMLTITATKSLAQGGKP
jgi:hypothetical protein